MAARLEFHPVTPDRWDEMVRLFGPRGACAGCWCMWPRLRGGEFSRLKGPGTRRLMRGIVARGEVPGIIAHAGGEPVGWCAVAPRTEYARLEGSRVMAPVDDQPVWSVPCFFVARAWRKRGLPTRLLREAVRFAASRGARIVEGYPIDLRGGRSADAFLWHGLVSSFERAGFTEVARRSPSRPIMRRRVRSTAGARTPHRG